MQKENKNPLNINVTKIVKYVCLAGVVIVGIIFSEKGYAEFVRSRIEYQDEIKSAIK